MIKLEDALDEFGGPHGLVQSHGVQQSSLGELKQGVIAPSSVVFGAQDIGLQEQIAEDCVADLHAELHPRGLDLSLTSLQSVIE